MRPPVRTHRTSFSGTAASGHRTRIPRGRGDLLFRAAFVALALLSAFSLGGCRAVEAIFKVGAWFGALIVIAIVAVIGGIVALVARK